MAVSSNQVVKYAILGFGAYTLYGLALTGALGAGAAKFAGQLKAAWGDTPGAMIGLTPGAGGSGSGGGSGAGGRAGGSAPQNVSTSPATDQWLPTGLRDLGQVPVDYNPSTRQLKQSASWVAQYAPGMPQNVYSDGVFYDAAGNQYQFAGGQLRDGAGRTLAATAFLVA